MNRQLEQGYLHIDGEPHRVLGTTEDQTSVRLRAPDGEEYEIPVADYRRARSEGRVVDRPFTSSDYRVASPKEIKKQQFRLAILRLTDALQGEGKTWKEILPELKQMLEATPEFAGLEVPSIRQIQIWRKVRDDAGVAALVPQTHKCGNRTKRYDDDFEEVVLDVVERHWLKHDRATVTGIIEKAQEEYEEKYGHAPALNSGRKVVETILESISYDDQVRARLGLRDSRKLRRKAKFHIAVEKPFDRVEIDCTTADVFAAGETGESVGRPTVCAAVDCATGLLLGLALTLGPADSNLVARVLKEVMTPKDMAFFERFGIKHPILDAYGRPLVAVWDRGSENKGREIERILKVGMIEARPCLPGHPERKPFVERTMGENNRCLRTLPGAASSILLPGLQRIEKAEAEACLPLEAIEYALQRWRYDRYHRKVRRAVVSALRRPESPNEAFERLSGFLPPAPSAYTIHQMFMLPGGMRCLQHYGIDFRGLRFMSSAVERMLSEFGAGTKDVEVHYDPADARTILVRHPKTGNDAVAHCKEPNMPAVDFARVEALHKRLGLNADEPVSMLSIVEDVMRSAEGHSDGKPRSKGAARKTAEISKRKARAIIERSRRQPELAPFAPDASPIEAAGPKQAASFVASTVPLPIRKRQNNV